MMDMPPRAVGGLGSGSPTLSPMADSPPAQQSGPQHGASSSAANSLYMSNSGHSSNNAAAAAEYNDTGSSLADPVSGLSGPSHGNFYDSDASSPRMHSDSAVQSEPDMPGSSSGTSGVVGVGRASLSQSSVGVLNMKLTSNTRKRRKTAELNLDVPCEWPGCTKRYASRTAMMLHVKLKHPTFYSQLDSQRAAGATTSTAGAGASPAVAAARQMGRRRSTQTSQSQQQWKIVSFDSPGTLPKAQQMQPALLPKPAPSAGYPEGAHTQGPGFPPNSMSPGHAYNSHSGHEAQAGPPWPQWEHRHSSPNSSVGEGGMPYIAGSPYSGEMGSRRASSVLEPPAQHRDSRPHIHHHQRRQQHHYHAPYGRDVDNNNNSMHSPQQQHWPHEERRHFSEPAAAYSVDALAASPSLAATETSSSGYYTSGSGGGAHSNHHMQPVPPGPMSAANSAPEAYQYAHMQRRGSLGGGGSGGPHYYYRDQPLTPRRGGASMDSVQHCGFSPVQPRGGPQQQYGHPYGAEQIQAQWGGEFGSHPDSYNNAGAHHHAPQHHHHHHHHHPHHQPYGRGHSMEVERRHSFSSHTNNSSSWHGGGEGSPRSDSMVSAHMRMDPRMSPGAHSGSNSHSTHYFPPPSPPPRHRDHGHWSSPQASCSRRTSAPPGPWGAGGHDGYNTNNPHHQQQHQAVSSPAAYGEWGRAYAAPDGHGAHSDAPRGAFPADEADDTASVDSRHLAGLALCKLSSGGTGEGAHSAPGYDHAGQPGPGEWRGNEPAARPGSRPSTGPRSSRRASNSRRAGQQPKGEEAGSESSSSTRVTRASPIVPDSSQPYRIVTPDLIMPAGASDTSQLRAFDPMDVASSSPSAVAARKNTGDSVVSSRAVGRG